MQSILNNASWLTRSVSLRDRFGDNGLISVLLAKIEGDELWIDTWLMSCRVLKRGVEQALLSHLVSASKERGLSAIRGEYIPSAKNGLVRDHYATLGFHPVDSDDSGRTTWILPLDESWVTPGTFIKES
jgi:FkbH-like protein